MLIIVLAAVCVVVVIAQLIYGAQGRALPFTSIDGRNVAGDTAVAIERDIQSGYGDARLQVTVEGRNLNTTLSAAGLIPDSDRSIRQVIDYPLWQRFTPFTILKGLGANYPVYAQLDDERFTEFTKTVTSLCAIQASDASVAVIDGVLRLTPAQVGATCSLASLRDQFAHLPLSMRLNYKVVQPTTVQPAVSTDAAKQLLVRAQALIDRRLTLTVLNEAHTPDAATIAGWVVFTTDAATKRPTVGLSDDVIAAYLQTLQGSVYIAPGVTMISVLDGQEVGRTIGSVGRGIAIEHGLEHIKKQLMVGDGQVDLQLAVLQPTLQYSRSYSRTNAGLQALLSYIVEQKGDMAISVRQLGGAGLSAHARGDKVYTPASTYKLFVAYAVLKRIESGQMHWDDQAAGGRTVAACFDTMIIHSDNPCSEWFGQTIGWRTITDMLRGVGLSSATSLYTARGFEATANDEVLFLTKLQAGQLLSPTSTDRLLDVMKRQIYRSGIPAGVGGVVADKVGFLNGLLHDAAIIYAPGGTYVMVIMSNGSSWGQVADAARRVDAWLQ